MQLPSKEECTFEFFQKMLFFSLLDKQIIFLKKWIFFPRFSSLWCIVEHIWPGNVEREVYS